MRTRRPAGAGRRIVFPPISAGVCAFVLIAAGLAAYHNSFSGPFLFDDFSAIRDNPHIRTLWPLWETVTSPPEISVAGRPVVSVSLAVNYALGGLDVRGYHMFNLLLHLLAALAVFGIVRRTLLTKSLRPRYGEAASWLALAVALVWMVHPLLTESVDYLIQRTELLMGLCLLLTLYCVLRGATARHRTGWHAAAVSACLLGMGSKEVMVVAPVLVLLYDRTFLAGSSRGAWQARRGLYLALGLTWLALAALLSTAPRTTTAGFHLAITPWQYAATQCGVMLHYLRLAFWPHPLVVDYSDWPMAKTLAEAIPAVFVVALLAAAAAWALRRHPAAGFLGAWGFLILAPTSSVMPIVTELAAERRMYLPLAAVAAGAVFASVGLLRRVVAGPRLRAGLAMGLLVLLAAVLSWRTTRRNDDYRSEVRMLRDVIATRPHNARAHYNLGIALAEQHQVQEALAHFEEALRLQPAYAEAHHNLAVVLADQGRFDDAVTHFQDALRLKPELLEAHNHLGVVLVKQGKVDDAIAHYTDALRLQPAYAEAHSNLGIALAEQGRRIEAIRQFAEALRLQPDYAKAHSNWGAVLAAQGRFDEAIAHYTDALRLESDLPETHNNLGVALAKQGKLEEASAQFLEALRLKPDYATAYKNWRATVSKAGRVR